MNIIKADKFYSFIFVNMTKSSGTKGRLRGFVVVVLS
jgi:hypothetical protein